uniref:ATP synthase F0 subunit 8 n=1 Tax=Epiphora bauhiniae TaxID=2909401 RepID=UPI001F1353E2|nr:ATP synthase F0 subunit 8 [Epiphora bauhiniae]ULO26052.1 ATP synthase F0 subunit 8 [Epiphora bauhiniae]
MPQMMPINWMFSFIFFIIIFFIFNIMNYYIFNLNMNKSNNKLMTKKIKNFIWKW